MATKQLGWLIALLVATPALYVACGGDEASTTTTSTATGTGGATTGSGGSTTTGGSGGTATGGSGGTAGSGGSAGTGGGVPDAGVMCGTMTCTTNPTGTNICDTANMRCVDCLTDRDCDVETINKVCDMRPNMAGLPAYNCVQCTDTAQCPAGSTCSTMGNSINTCITPCGTANCTTNPTGNNICDAPNNRCVDCLTDADCAVEMTNKHCDTSVNPTNMLPRFACEECLENSHCAAGSLCVDNNCEPTCMTDADCSADGGGNNPHCNPTTHVCGECGSDSHCSGNTPICIPAGTCEECTTDAHCMTTQPMTPYCRITDFNCVACLTNDHCMPPATCSARGGCTGGIVDGGGRGG